jgi:predicted O-methyltransferase YrrM
MVFLKQRKVILQKLHFLQQQKNTQDSWSITWRLGSVLAELIQIYSPQNILEIGTSIGFSTLHIASALEGSETITTIEIDKTRFLEAKKTFEEVGITSQIIQLNCSFYDLLSKMSGVPSYDFIFLDALQPEYLKVIKYCLENMLIKKDTIVVCDNILSHSYMDIFEKEVSKLAKSTQRIDIDSGFLVIIF